MTTIAYHHKSKTVAWDSRRTRDGVITDDCADKSLVKDGVTFIFTGMYADREKLVNYYFGGKSEFIPECNAIAIESNVVYYCGVTSEHEFWREVICSDYTTGSGGSFATAAMDFGLGAIDAVEYAKSRCIYTGGKVNSLKVED